jgi:P-type Mg2+ transporter
LRKLICNGCSIVFPFDTECSAPDGSWTNPFLPLAAKQILLNNFLPDVPSIAISTDNVDPETVTRPERWQIKQVQRFMIVFGLISSVFDLLTFATLLLVFHANEATFQTTWFVISLFTELAVVLILRTHRPEFRSKPSGLLLWTTVVMSIVALPSSGRSPRRSVSCHCQRSRWGPC